MQAPQPNGVTGTQFTKVDNEQWLKDIRASPYAKFFIRDTEPDHETQYSLYDLQLGENSEHDRAGHDRAGQFKATEITKPRRNRKGEECGESMIQELRNPVPGPNYHRFIFLKNPTKQALWDISQEIELWPQDWLKAVKWRVLPKTRLTGDKGVWMFLELMTMWERTRKPVDKAPARPERKQLLQKIKEAIGWGTDPVDDDLHEDTDQGSVHDAEQPQVANSATEHGTGKRTGQGIGPEAGHNVQDPENDPNQIPESKLQDWMTRSVGILFAKQRDHWVFLIFFEPIKEDPNYEMTFNFRKIYRGNLPPEHPKNVHTVTDMYYEPQKHNLASAISFIAAGLKEKLFLDDLMHDIFWQWEDYFQYVRKAVQDIKDKVGNAAFHHTHCWALFEQELALMGIQYLVRAQESFVKLKRIHVNSNHNFITLPLDMKDLKENLRAVTEHSGQIRALNKHTIEMIYHHMTMKKADFAERSNKNMEFLAMCATIFLPLTLVTGIFGMHIHQLVPDESHVTWWVPTSIGLPITIVLVVFVYLTRFAPSVHAEKDVGPAILPFNLPTPV